MTKPELLQLMRLLSALESALLYDRQATTRMPVSLLEGISDATQILEREILKPGNWDDVNMADKLAAHDIGKGN